MLGKAERVLSNEALGEIRIALLQRRGRKRHEALERGAPVGVEPDMMIERALAVGRGRAGEIERAQPARASRRAQARPLPDAEN